MAKTHTVPAGTFNKSESLTPYQTMLKAQQEFQAQKDDAIKTCKQLIEDWQIDIKQDLGLEPVKRKYTKKAKTEDQSSGVSADEKAAVLQAPNEPSESTEPAQQGETINAEELSA